MKNLKKDYFNPVFSHIYVENSVREHPRVKQILKRFPDAEVIGISHYKDVFCRSRQDHRLQHRSQNLILAAKEGKLIYPGSPVCQSFGNDSFYYTSCIMNCIYDCEYCYLKGMYPSANIVVFVNIEDIFKEAEEILKEKALYLCVSYDSDLPALEYVAGYVDAWSRFAEKHVQRLKTEIRTKSADKRFFQSRQPIPNVIYAFTLSPQPVVERFEHYTPSFIQRTDCAARAVRSGFPVRLCFDPVIYLPGWQEYYEKMLDEVFRTVDMEKLVDVSVGTFRISKDYLKKMRKQEPDSEAVWFPYELENGFYQYPDSLMKEMEQFLVNRLKEQMPEEKIFLWKDGG